MRPLLALGILSLLIAAGCVTPASNVSPNATDLSAAVFTAIKKEHAPTAMKDGVKLDNWVYRPDAPGKFPVLIESRPYFGNLDPPASDGGQKFSKWLVEYFVPRGYVVVLHSIRGTGASEGCYDQGGVVEQQDEALTIEQFAAMDYSNGKVASIGKSYGGTTPWEAAIQQPPHLVTIVPIEGITRWYDYLWMHGVMINGPDFNAEYPGTISYDVPPGTAPPELANYPGKACQRQADMQVAGVQSLATGDETAWWQERDFAKSVDKINAANISVYLVHGLQDWNVKPDQVLSIYNKLTVPKRFVLGQQDHQYPLRDDWGADLLRWFDHFLKGADNGILQTPPVMVSDRAGEWRTENEWPPARATPTSFPVKGGAFFSDPQSEVKDGATGPDRLVWTSDALSQPTRLSGAPRLTFHATPTCPNAVVALTLFDVNATGWHRVTYAASDLRHHKSTTTPDNVMPGDKVSFDLAFEPAEQLLAQGDKLGLVIAGANDITQLGPACPQVTIDGATLTLPTIEARPASVQTPQPTTKKPDQLPWTS